MHGLGSLTIRSLHLIGMEGLVCDQRSIGEGQHADVKDAGHPQSVWLPLCVRLAVDGSLHSFRDIIDRRKLTLKGFND